MSAVWQPRRGAKHTTNPHRRRKSRLLNNPTQRISALALLAQALEDLE